MTGVDHRRISSTALSIKMGPGRGAGTARVLDERVHAVRDRVAGRLVAGDREQEEEQVELEVGQPLAVDLGVQQDAHDVVLRVLATVRGEALGERVELHRRRERVFA